MANVLAIFAMRINLCVLKHQPFVFKSFGICERVLFAMRPSTNEFSCMPVDMGGAMGAISDDAGGKANGKAMAKGKAKAKAKAASGPSDGSKRTVEGGEEQPAPPVQQVMTADVMY